MSETVGVVAVPERIINFRDKGPYYCDDCKQSGVLLYELLGDNDYGIFRINLCSRCINLIGDKFPSKIS